jgi:hypothetical protein
MAVNTLRNPRTDSGPGHEKSAPVFLPWIDGSLNLEEIFRDGIPARYLPKIAFTFFLCLLYIGISHQSNRTIQKLNRSRTLLEDLRVNYTTQKAELMYKSKQSELAKEVARFGLMESQVPPEKISIRKK